ncbi:C45 family autoproteolytic acyltransferase/hydolase [Crossiella sp. CA198]|uniref:C45 family autoproteolytic acyltransferase/hydolase n=1 Tax=Crossiella sp. CA198 TaxID=3455607 RepID=UPI003F8D2B08
MSVAVTVAELDGLRWAGLCGPRLEVFRALGERFRAEITEAVHTLPEWPALNDYARTDQGLVRLSRLSALTRTRHPQEYAELRAMATGANLPEQTLLLVNLRGDLPPPSTTAGCSDLAWPGRALAHNEDGGAGLIGRLLLLTLHCDGDVPVTALWYPGMLPSNAFALTGHGLAVGLDHLPVAEPAIAPGRHFVARALHRARDLDEAIRLLTTLPSAGGFAYNLAELSTGRVVQVEAVAGASAVQEAGAEPLWHTNHLRHLTLPELVTLSSRERAKVLDSLDPPAEPGIDWFLDVLTSAHPRGVGRPPGADDSATLCTCVVDLAAAEFTVLPRGGTRFTCSVADALAGPPAGSAPRG